MKTTEEKLVFNNVREQYVYEGLPVDAMDINNEFYILNLRDVHAVLPHRSPVYRANFFSFVFVKDGAGRYTTDDHAFDTVPGTIYFTNPGHYKSYEWRRLADVCLVTLSESFLKQNVHAGIFEEFPFLLAETVPPRVLPPEQFAAFEQLYRLIAEAYASGSLYRNRIIGNLFVVILLKIKEYFWADYNPIYEGNRSSQIVKQFKRTLEKHYRDLSRGAAERVFRVQDYAEAQNLHPNYLSHVIKTKTGKPIGTWIAEKTIAEARSQLQNASISIKEIAYMLGFGESANFSNYFKKHTGISPAMYRRQYQDASL